jgi:hypothetical protein
MKKRIMIGLFEITKVDNEAEESTLTELHSFERDEAVPVGTSFKYKDRTFVHSYDGWFSDDKGDYFGIIYVEQQKVIEVE